MHLSKLFGCVILVITVAGFSALAQGQLEATKAWELAGDFDGDGRPGPGDTLRYTVSITNTGAQGVEDALFADFPEPTIALLPGSVSASQGTVIKGNGPGDTSVIVDVGTLSPGQSAVITFEVRICACMQGSEVTNQGLVNAPGIELPTDDPATPEPDDPTVTPVEVPGEPALGPLSKTAALAVDADGSGAPSPGDTLRYTVRIPNVGTGTLREGVFFDAPDPATTLVVGSVTTTHGTVISGNAAGEASVVVLLESLEAGDTAQIAFEVTLNAEASGAICNQGFVKGPEGEVPTDDPDTPTPQDCTETPVTPPPPPPPPETPELGTPEKTVTLQVDADGNGAVSVGDTLRYTISIPNVGNVPVPDVVFTDTLEASVSLVPGSVTASQGLVISGNAPGERTIRVNLGTIEVGVTAVITFDVIINQGATSVSNQGLVETPDEDVPTDNPDTPEPDDPTDVPVEPQATPELIPPTKQADLQVDADGNGVVSVGDTLRYTVRIPNVGNGPATDVVFRDTVDPNTTLVPGSVTTTHGTIVSGNAPGERTVRVEIAQLPPGQTAVITFDVIINQGATSVSNQGVVETPTGDVPTDNPDTDAPGDTTDTPVSPPGPPVTPTKIAALQADADGSGAPSVGDTLRYTVRIPNVTVRPLAGVVFRDVLDPHTRLVAGSVRTSKGTVVVGNRVQDAQVRVEIGALAPGETVTIVFDARVQEATAQVSNQGTVDTPEGEFPTDNPDTDTPDDATTTPLGPVVSLPQAICLGPELVSLLSSTTFLVRFENASTDAEGDIVSVVWDFGDGTSCSNADPSGCSAQTADQVYAGDANRPFHIFKGQGRFLTRLTVTDSQGHTSTAQCPFIHGDPSIGEVLDVNGNNVLDTDEILTAIQYWVTGTPLPHTGGKVIDDRKILTLVALWIKGGAIVPQEGS